MPVLEIPKDYLIEINNKNIKIELPEKLLKKVIKDRKKNRGLSQLFGTLKNLKIDPIEYQKRMWTE